ncbi:MAG TPA: F0F1 ATP synthase subunit A [Opitutales bacterium]|nr:F0F1 ATP synthase subunit A [Opitutales bacterium]
MVNRTFRGIFAALILFAGQLATVSAVASQGEDANALAAESHAATASVHDEAVGEEAAQEGIPVAAPAVFTIPIGEKGLPITNSILMSWLVSIGLIIVVRVAVGKPKLVPGFAQGVVESIVEALRDLLEMIVGPKMIGKTFPILVGLFTFILIQNWSGLLPGLGAVGIREGGHIVPFLRPANADINMAFALTLVHFLAWTYFVMRYAGPKTLFLDLFGNKAPKSELPVAMYFSMFALFAFVGCIEVISLVFRNVSLPLRLFGNIFGGDNLMEHMTGLAGWFVPIPFYFMEILVGLVQAMVFTILVAVYIGQICNHSEEEHSH